MIDIEKSKNIIKNYIDNYDNTNEKIALKKRHIYRVANNSKNMAINLGLSSEDIQLAELIGLLHDIGRFEQLKIYNTYIDKNSVDHGDFGVKVLFEEGLIKDIIDDRQYDLIIKKAVYNHNKKDIEVNLNEREKLHCKIIRDADKLDIFRLLTVEKAENMYEKSDLSNEVMSDKIYKSFIKNKKVNYNDLFSAADTYVAHMAYIYDFNFDYGLKIINDNDYLNIICNGVKFNDPKTDKEMKYINKITKDYIQDRLNEDTICKKIY